MKTFEKFILLLFCVAFSKAESLLSIGKVCNGVDARHIEELKQLDGCQIIEGSIKVAPNDRFITEKFENLTFPLVTEIAGYLMIYKVAGLKSVGQLFPNLVAIRGGELMQDYAMVIFGNPDLENIGLNQLKVITNGAVRIEKNERLCYVNTVDWKMIVNNETYGKNVFEEKMNFCPKCEKGIKNCWNQQSSQNECSCNGNSCNANETCCEPSCLSCLDENVKACIVCKQFIAGIYPSQKCVETCPYRSYEYLSHRCISATECRNLNINKNLNMPFIPFQGICKLGCPDDFQIKNAVSGNKMSASCTPCLGRECWRKCKATIIDSVESAHSLKGCQIIDGHLEIQIKAKAGVNIEQVLMESLSGIVEIEDYLKISRSFPITSLKFLKNLQVIRGSKLESDKYSIVIWDNENLEHLFKNEQKLEIQNGKLFIHFNPKLCFDIVDKLSTSKTIENLENAQFTNGDKASCNVTKFEVELLETLSNAARIKWKPLKLANDEEILEYVIFFIAAPQQNVDLWNSRDTCGNDGWTAIDVKDFPPSIDSIFHTLPELHAFTQYAYYVKAYTSSKSQTGAQSDIQYFTTLPDKPETVNNLVASTKSDSEITLTWKPPAHINGELEKYEIEIRKLEVMKDFKQRNFCEHPFDISELKHEEYLTENSLIEPSKKSQTALAFDDVIKDLLQTRNKRSSQIDCLQESQKPDTDNLLRLEIVEPKATEFVINELRHYSSYSISIRACRKEDNRTDEHTTEGLCSDDIQVIIKTLESSTADIIHDFEVSVLPSNTSENHVKISWVPPKNPNGKILVYEVKLKQVDVENSKEEIICISIMNRENMCSQVIDKIVPGNYSFQIMALTFAGPGNYSHPKYIYIKSVSHLSLVTSPPFMALLFLIFGSIIAVFVFTIYKKNQEPEVVSRFENFDHEDHPMNG